MKERDLEEEDLRVVDLRADEEGRSPGSHLNGLPAVLLPEVERPLVLPDGDGVVQMERLHFILTVHHKYLHTHTHQHTGSEWGNGFNTLPSATVTERRTAGTLSEPPCCV